MAVKKERIHKVKHNAARPPRPASITFWPHGLNDGMRSNLRRCGDLTANIDGSLSLRPNRGADEQAKRLIDNLCRLGHISRRKPQSIRPVKIESSESEVIEPQTKPTVSRPRAKTKRARGASRYAAKVAAR